MYDRQLRVWGVEAQRRLGASRILVAGLTGLAAEACKNVALAGVGAVVLYDDGAPAKDAAPGNFLAAAGLADAAGTPDAEGLTVAAATAATLREMNPFGEISILVGPSDLSGIDVGGGHRMRRGARRRMPARRRRTDQRRVPRGWRSLLPRRVQSHLR